MFSSMCEHKQLWCEKANIHSQLTIIVCFIVEQFGRFASSCKDFETQVLRKRRKNIAKKKRIKDNILK